MEHLLAQLENAGAATKDAGLQACLTLLHARVRSPLVAAFLQDDHATCVHSPHLHSALRRLWQVLLRCVAMEDDAIAVPARETLSCVGCVCSTCCARQAVELGAVVVA